MIKNKEKLTKILKSYLFFLVIYLVLSFLVPYFIKNELILNPTNFFAILAAVSAGYLISLFITYFDKK